ncbi:MAG: replicative DNA helicase [Planctomycetota bacterium]|jgi:replicative DNA helicase
MSAPARTLPSADEAERSVIGCLLIDPAVYLAVSLLIRPTDFGSPSAAAAYAAIETLALAGRTADAVTVRDLLKREHAPPVEGWGPYLTQCALWVPSAAVAPEYARIVAEKAIRRSWFRLGERLLGEASTRPLSELADEAMEMIVAVAGEASDRPVRPAKAVAEELMNEISCGTQSLRTGLLGLDDAIGGIGRGDLIVIAGRPSMGKSTMAQNAAEHVAVSGHCVLIFTLEMPARSILARMVCTRTRVPLRRLQASTLTDEETEAVVAALEELAELDIYFCDRPNLRPADVLAECRRMKALHGLDLVIVDYLQLMQGGGAERREREVAQLSAGLKRIAGELDLPVLCLSQLNRDVEKRKSKRPRLADLRDSGSIEQDADVVLMLYREWVYDRSVPPDQAVIFVEKQRNGPPAEVPVRFLGEEFRFTDVGAGL